MFKQLSIISISIFFLIAIANSALSSNDDTEDDLDLNEQEQPIAISFSGKPIKAREFLDDDLLDSGNLYDLLKRATGFTNEQAQFQRELLQSHNNYRKRHCVPALQLDAGLSRSAQTYAEKLARTNTFQHSGTSGVGENLWSSWSSTKIGNIKGSQPTDDWYNEVKSYNFNNGGFSMQTGHFTQLVWKNTQRVGAGIAFNSDRTKAYVVAQYAPQGNVQGQYKQNVLPPRC